MFNCFCTHKLIGRKEIYKAMIMTMPNRMGILSAESAIGALFEVGPGA